MPRLDFLSDEQMPESCRDLLKHAEEVGSPDSRVLRIMFRSKAGEAWYRYLRALMEACT